MEAKLRFCDYLNDVTFMKIEDKGNHYEVTMRSVVDFGDAVTKHSFHTKDGSLTDKYFYLLHFRKAIL